MLILLIAGGAVLYGASLYIWPYKPHARCGGTGRNRGSSGRRFGVCPSRRCKNGTVQRIGSRAVHRAVRGAISYRKEK
jgi:hypothetical protein